jgi:hypothetical protein
MDPTEVFRILSQRPFRPLRVVMNDGRAFTIPTRRFAVVGVDYLDIGFQAEGYDDGVWGGCESVELQDVARVEPICAPPSTASS